VDGLLEFLFSIASGDLEVEVFPSWFDSINHDPSISFRNRHAMYCPTLDMYFSNTMRNQFDVFPLLIQKLAGGPHDDVIHRVMFLLVRNHGGLTSGWVLCGSDAATALGAGAALQIGG
jgi:hypothetical protein